MSQRSYNRYNRHYQNNHNDYYNYNNYYSRNQNYRQSERPSINLPEKYITLLKEVTWPSPSVLSNEILLSTPLDKFNYTEKIDGLHTFLLIFEKKIYNVTKNKDVSSIKQLEISQFKDMNFSGDCIIETEFYNDIYFIFDVYYLNGENYSEKYLAERIGAIKPLIEEFGPSFKLKTFKEIPDLNFLFEYIKQEKSPEGNDIDGVILQRIDRPYFMKNWDFNSFKLKPLHLNTVDFLLKYNYKYNNFYLYLSGDYELDYRNNFKKEPKDMTAFKLYDPTKPLNGNNLSYYKGKLLIYFDTPFYTNLGKLEINKNWNKENYSEKYIKIIDDLIDKISESPRQFDNKIVELSLTNDKKWVPVKIRNDKNKPNSYRVGLNNISIIFDPVKPLDSIYFQKDLSMNEEDRIIIHEINQTYRKYIIEKHVNRFGKYSSAIDLCGGRGADEFNLYSNGVSKFFVIDSDTTALKRYFDRTFKINKKNYTKLTNNYKLGLKWGRDYINLNFLNHRLDKDYSKILEDLNSRYEFKEKVDIVLMNYAVHYLCDDEEKIEKLSEFVNSVLRDDGIFIITYFDGDEILKRKENNISKIGPFDIEITKEEGNIASAKMPVPTIKSGNNYYIEEPLVLKNMIKKLEKYLDLYDEYYVYDKCIEYIEKINNKEKFIEYFKLIKVAVYTKKNN